MRRLLTRLLGDRGERAAARYLRRKGYKIIARQYRSTFGEIDLIARDGGSIVFVEVKTRTSTHRGHPVEAIDAKKQRKLTQLALAWLKRHRKLESRARIDVVAVVWPEDSKRPEITHYENAFEPTGQGQLFS